MSASARVTRRQFLTSTVATAGIVTVAHHLPARSPEAAQLAQSQTGAVAIDRVMPHRIDGLPKMVHTFFRMRFAEADFTVDNRTERRAIDGLALRRGGRPRYELIDRRDVAFPPAATARYDRSLYASGGHVIAVEVSRTTGDVKILEAVLLLDPGEVIHPHLLSGQIEGGFAQGVGYALFEELPMGAAGATPDWNLNRYRVPRAADLPLGRLDVALVPPPRDGILANGPRVRKKGIAEITLSTVAPAVGNAVAHAIGRRITTLPITPTRVLEALKGP